MRSFLIGLMLGVGALVIASPLAFAQSPAEAMSAISQCTQDCWNESAAQAGCDPNADDDCLCGPFFDLVTTCVSQTCGTADNLEVLNTLDTACE